MFQVGTVGEAVRQFVEIRFKSMTKQSLALQHGQVHALLLTEGSLRTHQAVNQEEGAGRTGFQHGGGTLQHAFGFARVRMAGGKSQQQNKSEESMSFHDSKK